MAISYYQWYIHQNLGHNAGIYIEIKTQDITQRLTMRHTQKDKLWYAARFATYSESAADTMVLIFLLAHSEVATASTTT